jgi:hypothetical protein
MDSVLQYLFLYIWITSCSLVGYAIYKITRRALNAMFNNLFPSKTVTMTVHEENGDVVEKEFQTSNYKAIVDNILLEAQRRETGSKHKDLVRGYDA